VRHATPVKRSAFWPHLAHRLIAETMVVVAHPESDVEESDRRRPPAPDSRTAPTDDSRSSQVRQLHSGSHSSAMIESSGASVVAA
jgi:hypothetical protein